MPAAHPEGAEEGDVIDLSISVKGMKPKTQVRLRKSWRIIWTIDSSPQGWAIMIHTLYCGGIVLYCKQLRKKN